MASKEIVFKNLHDLYEVMGLPVDSIDPSTGFTIHFLQETFKTLPFTSIPFRPNYFSFLFIKNAFGRYTIDDHIFDVEPGTVYFTNPGNYRIFEWHQITDICLITFSEAYLQEFVHHDVYKDFSFLLTETVEPRILGKDQFMLMEQLYQQIYHEWHLRDSPYKNKLAGSMMVTLLLKIKEYFFQDYNPIDEGNRGSQIVKTFKQDLNQHFRDLINGKADTSFRVQDYADKQALHMNYLSTVISNKTGKSISAWIADKTITEAKILLQDPTIPIKQIAGRLGFLEAAHFSNYFKKNTSVSPAEYRRQIS